MRYTLFIGLLLTGFACMNILPISIVYNFRIAQITKQPIVEDANRNTHTIIALLFDQYLRMRDNSSQNFIGGLAAYLYTFHHYYFRVDMAASGIAQSVNHVPTFSGANADDILFTAGKSFHIHDRAVITGSGLFGIPTHPIFALQHADFGYGQIGLGLQLDGSYTVSHLGDLLWGARYIHFVPRPAYTKNCQRYIFTSGDLADILLAYKNYWHQHGLEFGYTARWRFGANICPNLDDIVAKANYFRNNFYLVYKYKFRIGDVHNRFLLNIAYGFDSSPKRFGSKFITTIWAAWNIAF